VVSVRISRPGDSRISQDAIQELAGRAERTRHHRLEESYNGVLHKRPTPILFTVASKEWLELKESTLAPKSYGVEVNSLKHLTPYFGQRLVSDIDAADIARYVGHRRKQQVGPKSRRRPVADKSIKHEIATLRGILKRARVWADIVDDELLPMLGDRDDVGRAISADEETALLAVCWKSRSRGLATAVVIALNTGMREGEIRRLRWDQIDFDSRTITVGKAKTAAGTGRPIPMNDRLTLALRTWANRFHARASVHYVFPAEQYGRPGTKTKKPGTYAADPTTPIGSWKTAWKNARTKANVSCRFHDLRHSAVTRLLEGGVSFPIVASLLGWSASTTTKMARRYGHIGNAAHRQAVATLDPAAGASKVGTKSGTTDATTDQAKAASA
jgi:integrase